MNDAVRALARGPDGALYAAGDFTTANGVALPDSLAVWTGSAWLPVDVNLPGTPQVAALACSATGLLVAGFNTSGSAVSAVVTVPSNAGTKAFPKFKLTGPGTLWQIRNYTSGKAIYFTDLTLLAGETAWLDLTPGQISFSSSWRGNLLYTVAPGSNLASFSLLPGNNNISAFFFGSTSAATGIFMQWPNTYWAMDGGAN
jgi:hypothetical protein